MESALNQTALNSDYYAFEEIHKVIPPLLAILEHRKEVAKKAVKISHDRDYVQILENLNNEILKVLRIPKS